MYNENKTSTSLKTLQCFENGSILKISVTNKSLLQLMI